MPARVLAVGNCGPDNAALTRLIESSFDARLDPVETMAEARRMLADGTACDLVLVNRIGDADAASGLDLIAWLAETRPETPAMLISNFADAQQAAETAGARPGFGKSALASDETRARLAAVLPTAAGAG